MSDERRYVHLQNQAVDFCVIGQAFGLPASRQAGIIGTQVDLFLCPSVSSATVAAIPPNPSGRSSDFLHYRSDDSEPTNVDHNRAPTVFPT
ncbi:MAG: hypothetical protein WCL32_04750 [Planctomycetota bacterium]